MPEGMGLGIPVGAVMRNPRTPTSTTAEQVTAESLLTLVSLQ